MALKCFGIVKIFSAETKELEKDGKPFTLLRMRVSARKKFAKGEQKYDWFNATMFNPTEKQIAILKKDARIEITDGTVTTSEGKPGEDGKKRTFTDIEINKYGFDIVYDDKKIEKKEDDNSF